MADGVQVLADLLEQAGRLELRDDPLPRLEPVEPAEPLRHGVVQLRVRGHHVEGREAVARGDLEVHRVVGGRHLHHAGPEGGVDGGIRDDRHQPVHEREADLLADEVPVPLVVRVHGHAGVAEHRLRPGRRHHDVRRCRRRAGSGGATAGR